MASPSLSRILHADPAAPHPPPSTSFPHPQQSPQQQQQQHQQQLLTLPPVLASVNTPGYQYPPAPSTASPAASGTPNSLSTPVGSPTATSAPASIHGSSANGGSVNGSSTAVSRGHALNTSLYQCADCLKRYSRPEHLQRHIATHTLGKRFVCEVRPCRRCGGLRGPILLTRTIPES